MALILKSLESELEKYSHGISKTKLCPIKLCIRFFCCPIHSLYRMKVNTSSTSNSYIFSGGAKENWKPVFRPNPI
jgi:hypothetical protein